MGVTLIEGLNVMMTKEGESVKIERTCWLL